MRDYLDVPIGAGVIGGIFGTGVYILGIAIGLPERVSFGGAIIAAVIFVLVSGFVARYGGSE